MGEALAKTRTLQTYFNYVTRHDNAD
ncbi:hypothetical protein XAC3810_390043 [Xanthomonas citri pv. citri]|uniref:Uncharacterized protein n=1 Tax=Xanthomonas citri pv. citri TaxID=611301 RepID=A0A0U5BT16_XANCI|nr:hypothetical protein XAC9322_400005 [Xanthomonas citri pv. citri]CEE26132.1 hypothetical protein XAC3824_430033 [Xanthomonas citri pv. citri]CEE27680.1 hypothetical protein XAC1083_400033 [Xanthomonas citri pv. citri]CEE37060.1 hypothetical protein XAC3810_390043 [Xanthomonas citri pv. citri]CEE59839.1 hypothetical protein XAC71A_480034 [Xanthomonas citri pv. citri]